jgi:hypothetical protein
MLHQLQQLGKPSAEHSGKKERKKERKKDINE